MKTAVCLYVKDEERDIAEWMSYYFVLGFDTIFVYNNESSDRTADIAKKASNVSDVRLIYWPLVHRRAHWIAYEDCLARAGTEFDWIAFVDVDEFIVPKSVDSIVELLQPLSQHSGVAIHWAIFGSSGHIDYPEALVIESFTRRGPDEISANRHVKSIVKPAEVKRLFSSHNFELEGTYCLPDGSPVNWERHGKLATLADFSVCQLNHYFVRSRAHWDAKVRRGYKDMRPREEQEFVSHDRNEILDTGAVRFAPLVREHMARYT